jgi:hypothetical protein
MKFQDGVTVYGASAVKLGRAAVPPVIDGVMREGEWAGAVNSRVRAIGCAAMPNAPAKRACAGSLRRPPATDYVGLLVTLALEL